MRPLPLLASLFLVASGAVAQNPPGPPPPPDTTSAWRYYPLHFADAWEYSVEVVPGEGAAYSYTAFRQVRADTLVDGRRYAVVAEWSRDVPTGLPAPEAQRYLARFDTVSARIVTREIGGDTEVVSPCPLSAPFPRNSEEPRETACDDDQFWTVVGGYEQSVGIGGETYTLTAKTLSFSGAVDVSETFAADVGLVQRSFEDAGSRSMRLTTARIQGTIYGDAPEVHFPGIPDTTDAARYYPLGVGDLWQYRYCSGPKGICATDRITLREVVNTEEVRDTSYAVVRDRVFNRTGIDEGDYVFTRESQQFVRFDRLTSTVRIRDESGEVVSSCPLDADLEAEIRGDICDGVYVVGTLRGELGTKSFTIGETSDSYQADVGLTGRFGGFNTSEELVYSRVGGVERGTPVPVVDVAGEAEPLAEALSLTAFPNPTAGPLALDLTGARGPVQLEAFDALGRRVLSREVAPEAQIEIDASGWAPGVYVLRAISGDAAVTTRVVRR